MAIRVGPVYRRGLRVIFIWWPLGILTERYGWIDRLVHNHDVIAELILWLGPLLRAGGAILPALIIAAMLAGAPVGVPVVEARTGSVEYWRDVMDSVREKLDAHTEARGQHTPQGAPEAKEFTWEPEVRLRTLVHKTVPGTLYKILIDSRRYNLSHLLEKCRYYTQTEQHWCQISIVVNGQRPVNRYAFHPASIRDGPQLIHPSPYHPGDWLRRLELWVMVPDDEGLVIKATGGFGHVRKARLRLTDMTAWMI